MNHPAKPPARGATPLAPSAPPVQGVAPEELNEGLFPFRTRVGLRPQQPVGRSPVVPIIQSCTNEICQHEQRGMDTCPGLASAK